MSTSSSNDFDKRTELLTERLEIVASHTDEPGGITRWFLSDSLRRLHATIRGWLDPEKFAVEVDAVGNLHIRARKRVDGPVLLCGSHLDSVRGAGKYDGPLGFLLALDALEYAPEGLPFNIDVVGFSDEEGSRFQCAYLGSSYLAGKFPRDYLYLRDENGVTMEQALRDWGTEAPFALVDAPPMANLLGYFEAHIEQGPILEEQRLSCAAVSGIAAQNRASVVIRGTAAHAGTTPWPLRRDSLVGVADFIMLLEKASEKDLPLRATVGMIENHPNASNVVSEWTKFSLDLRHPRQSALDLASEELHALALAMCDRRRLRMTWDYVMRQPSVDCDLKLTRCVEQAIKSVQPRSLTIPSGAGHDAVAMSAICPTAMMFIRCRKGISHHPDEYVSPQDLRVATEAYAKVIENIAARSVLK